MIYLDSAATTMIAPEVLKEMMPYLTDRYGNAGTQYSLGREAASAVQKAREQTAGLFGCTPDHVIFTSGGSESNNMVFNGIRGMLAESGKNHLVVSAIEHESVIRASESLIKHGFYITYVQPDSSGIVQPDAVEAAIQDDTGLVSVMYVNNETGAVNDIHTIGQICRAKSVLFHTDCVQAAGQFPIEVDRNCIDFASVSAHKIHGPKGIGALYVREPNITPLVYGGTGQEFGLRGGTENVAGIVGLGKACEMVAKDMREEMIAVSSLKQRFYRELTMALDAYNVDLDTLHINGRSVSQCGKTLSLRFDGVDAGTLVLMLDARDVCASAGSACHSHESTPSHVLTAMGLSPEEARSSVRFSFSRFNTEEEVICAARAVADCVSVLKAYKAE